MRPLKALLLVALAIVLLGVALFAWVKVAPREVPAGQPPLLTLGKGSLPGFRDTFNAAENRARILVLLSPT